MKIFIGRNYSCALNYEYQMLMKTLSPKYPIVEDVKEADIIIFTETCSNTKYDIINTLSYMVRILKEKKEEAKVYMTGCMAREFKNDSFLNDVKTWIETNIDAVIPPGKVNSLLQLISMSEFGELNKDDFGYAYRRSQDRVNAYITQGCRNHCSFCKTTFQNHPLKSVNYEEVINLIDTVNELAIPQLALIGTNLCQFGLDTCGKHRLPELLEYLETTENIRLVRLIGFAFKDAIQNGFDKVLANTNKEYIISGSLESGSNRLLELIRKGFTREEIIQFVENIKKTNHIDLIIDLIAGFPTETLEDVKMTLEVLKQLKPKFVGICRYTNSNFMDSSHYEQLLPQTIQEHARVYEKVLSRRKILNSIIGNGYLYN